MTLFERQIRHVKRMVGAGERAVSSEALLRQWHWYGVDDDEEGPVPAPTTDEAMRAVMTAAALSSSHLELWQPDTRWGKNPKGSPTGSMEPCLRWKR